MLSLTFPPPSPLPPTPFQVRKGYVWLTGPHDDVERGSMTHLHGSQSPWMVSDGGMTLVPQIHW